MRTTLNIPDDLLAEVQKLSGQKSKTKAIIIAMEEFVRQKRIRELVALRGKIRIDYNWKKEERLEIKAQKKRKKIL